MFLHLRRVILKIPQPNRLRFSIGGDPEFFALSAKGNIRPLHNAEFPKSRRPVLNSDGTFGHIEVPELHRDGCAIELNCVVHPCRGNFVKDLSVLMRKAMGVAVDNGGSLAAVAEAPILKTSLRGAPADMLRGGCDPDYDAYTGDIKTPAPYATNMRYAGGHIHFGVNTQKRPQIGWFRDAQPYDTSPIGEEDELVALYSPFIKLLDLWVGVPAVAMLGAIEQSKEANRRQYYGQAGSFRVQPHGVEYRTLSSAAWREPNQVSGLLGMARMVVNHFFKNEYEVLALSTADAARAEKYLRILDENTVRHIIDTHDYQMAQDFVLAEMYPGMGYVHPTWNAGGGDTSYEPIATAMAAWTYGAQNGEYVDTSLSKNYARQGMQAYYQGPAFCLALGDNWSFRKYVDPFIGRKAGGDPFAV